MSDSFMRRIGEQAMAMAKNSVSIEMSLIKNTTHPDILDIEFFKIETRVNARGPISILGKEITFVYYRVISTGKEHSVSLSPSKKEFVSASFEGVQMTDKIEQALEEMAIKISSELNEYVESYFDKKMHDALIDLHSKLRDRRITLEQLELFLKEHDG